MDRARRAAADRAHRRRDDRRGGASDGPGGVTSLVAAVGWPTSTLVVSEVQTGGASASDEFVEIANQGACRPICSASRSSTRRRPAHGHAQGDVGRVADPGAGPAPAPGERLRRYAALADATYSGGIAATGGAVALRVVGGSVIDAVGWGDATNGFVEGAAAPAPSAGSSIERAPGGAAGNVDDTNDNATDWFVHGAPSPQNLGAPPCRSRYLAVADAGCDARHADARPTSTGTPTPTPSPTPALRPRFRRPSRRRRPTPTPTPATPIPTPTPTPADRHATPTRRRRRRPPVTIAEARAAADGTTVTVEGVLTTALGALESGRTGFVQDETGGIAVYLDAAVVGSWPAGTAVTVHGTIGTRFAQRTLRAAESAVERGPARPARALALDTGDAVEPDRGSSGHRHRHGLRAARRPGRRTRSQRRRRIGASAR